MDRGATEWRGEPLRTPLHVHSIHRGRVAPHTPDARCLLALARKARMERTPLNTRSSHRGPLPRLPAHIPCLMPARLGKEDSDGTHAPQVCWSGRTPRSHRSRNPILTLDPASLVKPGTCTCHVRSKQTATSRGLSATPCRQAAAPGVARTAHVGGAPGRARGSRARAASGCMA
eukprot:356333-Chlamydomonas_euryale.AAC.1